MSFWIQSKLKCWISEPIIILKFNPLKTIFFGTPDFAAYALEYIVKHSNHEVVVAVTAPDKPKGRGRATQPPAVKIKAEHLGIPVLQPTNLKNEAFLKEIADYEAEIFIVVAFRMMPEVLYSLPRYGTFNLHASLLPDYRGAAPINFAIINGEKTTGVTTFFINQKIDEGEILLQKTTDINPEENAGSLHDKLMHLGAELIVETLDGIEKGVLKSTPQASVSEKLAYKIHKEDLEIDWNVSAEEARNFIRGMSPYPAAFCKYHHNGIQKSMKIYLAAHAEEITHLKAGELEWNSQGIFVGCQDHALSILELQPEGKKRMNAKDFLNGIRSEDVLEMIMKSPKEPSR